MESQRGRAGTRLTPSRDADPFSAASGSRTVAAADLRTGRGHRWTAAGVARVRASYAIYGPRTVAVQDGEVSVKQAAAELGIPADAVYNWLRPGQVPARRGPSGGWCIPWDPATQEIYRQKVDNSVRLKPILRRNADEPARPADV
jgi:hypothetical protein